MSVLYYATLKDWIDMRTFDADDAAQLQAEPWMVAQLELNPDYVSWGPHEDYMWVKGGGWNAPIIHQNWPDGKLNLDDLNEVANFYFEINRPSIGCETCGGLGIHPDAQWISESFYSHSSPFKSLTAGDIQARTLLERFGSPTDRGVLYRGVTEFMPAKDVFTRYGSAFFDFCIRTRERGGYWNDDITEDEAEALVKAGRGSDVLNTAAAFNLANIRGAGGLGHDAINRWILIQQRCKRLGVPYECPNEDCHEGYCFTGPAYLTLVAWVLHPRKGCSRGWEINHIQEHELPDVHAWLRLAAQRNADRFAKIPGDIK